MEEYIDISNDTQLNYYEQRLSHLIGQEISQLFSLDYALTLIALLFSMGAMMMTFIQSHKDDTTPIWIFGMTPHAIVTFIILLFVLGYAIYVHFKHTENQKQLPKMIEITQKAIENYKKTKAEK